VVIEPTKVLPPFGKGSLLEPSKNEFRQEASYLMVIRMAIPYLA
jgi:hypothetical protein